ncbi:MAG: putative lipid II flippase FtsW [Xanthomonadales bacterium]|nr:putative lipid II flippase FtsW [Gammaproteobacteria bacterium]MBT8052589.1 putative lipid II flippase FtsW [Gammaproteobacteria bacterium]NND56652.1 putative lipid II flippase FtsW [Xanthomonadales bacterium]NNK52406.1 putative lipid II flippase FtsW [Xanthomonadales bacterium]
MRKMTASIKHPATRGQAFQAGSMPVPIRPDSWILLPALLLLSIGIVMVGSASIAIAEGQGASTYHYLARHLVFIGAGVFLASMLRVIPMAFFERISRPMLALSVLLLLLVLVPGVGHTVNGSTRWVRMGFVNFQVVEAVKLMVIIYLAGYLARKARLVQSRFFDTFKPLIFAGILSAILLLQPDMGSAAVITAIVAGMVWLAGAAWRHILVLGLLTLPAFGFAAMEPYRLRRIVSFMDPWADPFASGFQLTQALIAVGRGELFGVGIGASIQKLFYLPEAHTDFIFAVLAEEFGLVGVLAVLLLFLLLVTRIMVIGVMAHRKGKPFAGFVAYGIGLWIGLQALVSIGVNLGVLPTKGLTLPLISSGGSSMLMSLIAVGIVLRIKYEMDQDNVVYCRARKTVKKVPK